MNAPLTDLDPIHWLVWADWCQENGRVKAERFARKCARSLQKMLAVGCDPRATLYAGTSFAKNGGPDASYDYLSAGNLKKVGRGRWKFCDPYDPYELMMVVDGNGVRPAAQSYLINCYWRKPPRVMLRVGDPYPAHFLNSPADLPVEWQQTRLAFKFWKLLNRRALGIKDSVLEVPDAERDRV